MQGKACTCKSADNAHTKGPPVHGMKFMLLLGAMARAHSASCVWHVLILVIWIFLVPLLTSSHAIGAQGLLNHAASALQDCAYAEWILHTWTV